VPTQTVPYEFLPDIRRRAEELRMANVRQAVRGSIALHSITADRMATGVLQVGDGGGVTITPEAITAPMMATNVLRVGTSGAVTIDNDAITAPMLNVDTLSAITATMGSLTAGDITSTTFTGGLIQSGTTSPQATFSGNGIVLTNAQTSEAVNHAPSHVDFYSDSGADEKQKGTIACFIGGSIVNYAPHFTVRALLPVNSVGNPVGRASLSAWDDQGNEFHTLGVYAHSVVVNNQESSTSVSLAYIDGSTTKLSGSWSDGDLSAKAFHSLPSDRAAKKNIKKLSGTLDAVRALRPVSYVLKKDGEAKVGFVAEEVSAVIPDAVRQVPVGHDKHTGEPTDTVSGVDLMQLITHAIGAVQELASRVEALERH
jgi:hypothetical protein